MAEGVGQVGAMRAVTRRCAVEERRGGTRLWPHLFLIRTSRLVFVNRRLLRRTSRTGVRWTGKGAAVGIGETRGGDETRLLHLSLVRRGIPPLEGLAQLRRGGEKRCGGRLLRVVGGGGGGRGGGADRCRRGVTRGMRLWERRRLFWVWGGVYRAHSSQEKKKRSRKIIKKKKGGRKRDARRRCSGGPLGRGERKRRHQRAQYRVAPRNRNRNGKGVKTQNIYIYIYFFLMALILIIIFFFFTKYKRSTALLNIHV